jgi:selenide,water dikinase
LFGKEDYPDLIVGLGEPDDAAVWRIDDERALIITTDFFTPVVDDPYQYGAIAAANSLSDVYAMGGKPFLALNVAAFPPNLPPEIPGEILRGGAEKTREAGVVLAGGHTIQDQEPKYGLICLGFVHPDQIMTKAAAKVGDQLLLSKPLGFGTTTTAIKKQIASPEDIADVVRWMSQLNRGAAELAVECGVRAATDITGFSLLGHAWEMASASRVGMRLEWEKLPFLEGAMKYAEQFSFPGGAFDNKLFFEKNVRLTRSLKDGEEMLLYDPQTSGGLLFAASPTCAEEMLRRAEDLGQPLWTIGEVVEGETIEVI